MGRGQAKREKDENSAEAQVPAEKNMFNVVSY